MSTSTSVFVFRTVAEDREIGLVAADGNPVLFYGLDNSAAGFVGMRAIAETAVRPHPENLAEEMTDLFPLKINRSEAFDSRRVN